MTDFDQMYRTLRLPAHADITELRRKYRALAQQWHPDRHRKAGVPRDAAEAIFKEITRAYHRLTNYHKTYQTLPLQHMSLTPSGPINPESAVIQHWRRPAAIIAVSAALTIIAAGLLTMLLFSDGPKPALKVNHEHASRNLLVGDTPEKVVEVLGQPTYLSRNRWQYETVDIFFEDGAVSGWHEKRSATEK